MTTITREQRVAIKRVFDRTPHYFQLPYYKNGELVTTDVTSNQAYKTQPALTYKQFRKRVLHGYDCLMVQWCGMWLGIEPDGYTHS